MHRFLLANLEGSSNHVVDLEILGLAFGAVPNQCAINSWPLTTYVVLTKTGMVTHEASTRRPERSAAIAAVMVETPTTHQSTNLQFASSSLSQRRTNQNGHGK